MGTGRVRPRNTLISEICGHSPALGAADPSANPVARASTMAPRCRAAEAVRTCRGNPAWTFIAPSVSRFGQHRQGLMDFAGIGAQTPPRVDLGGHGGDSLGSPQRGVVW